jgi:hypothetical protein
MCFSISCLISGALWRILIFFGWACAIGSEIMKKEIKINDFFMVTSWVHLNRRQRITIGYLDQVNERSVANLASRALALAH